MNSFAFLAKEKFCFIARMMGFLTKGNNKKYFALLREKIYRRCSKRGFLDCKTLR